ncbi:hypothetical protein H4582DRAFT_2142924 [Lactarius indigo]|nr:hypothetical protein H4582DRAFT_2142924 [Lactarius indigo]
MVRHGAVNLRKLKEMCHTFRLLGRGMTNMSESRARAAFELGVGSVAFFMDAPFPVVSYSVRDFKRHTVLRSRSPTAPTTPCCGNGMNQKICSKVCHSNRNVIREWGGVTPAISPRSAAIQCVAQIADFICLIDALRRPDLGCERTTELLFVLRAALDSKLGSPKKTRSPAEDPGSTRTSSFPRLVTDELFIHRELRAYDTSSDSTYISSHGVLCSSMCYLFPRLGSGLSIPLYLHVTYCVTKRAKYAKWHEEWDAKLFWMRGFPLGASARVCISLTRDPKNIRSHARSMVRGVCSLTSDAGQFDGFRFASTHQLMSRELTVECGTNRLRGFVTRTYAKHDHATPLRFYSAIRGDPKFSSLAGQTFGFQYEFVARAEPDDPRGNTGLCLLCGFDVKKLDSKVVVTEDRVDALESEKQRLFARKDPNDNYVQNPFKVYRYPFEKMVSRLSLYDIFTGSASPSVAVIPRLGNYVTLFGANDSDHGSSDGEMQLKAGGELAGIVIMDAKRKARPFQNGMPKGTKLGWDDDDASTPIPERTRSERACRNDVGSGSIPVESRAPTPGPRLTKQPNSELRPNANEKTKQHGGN